MGFPTDVAWEPDYLPAHVLFSLAFDSGPPPIQTGFQRFWPGSGQSQPFILDGAGLKFCFENDVHSRALWGNFHNQPRWLPLICHTSLVEGWVASEGILILLIRPLEI